MMQAETSPLPLPELDELLDSSDARVIAEDRARQMRAALVAITSLALGLSGNILFHTSTIGINVFLFAVLCLMAVGGALFYFRRPIVWYHVVFAVPAALFALLLAVRLAPELRLFNILALFGCVVILLYFNGTPRFLGGWWFAPIGYGIELVMAAWFFGLQAVVPDTLRWAGRAELDTRHLGTAKSVLRGLVFALPVIIVFALLLSSADAVFGRLTGDVLHFLLPASAEGIIEQVVLTAGFTVIGLTLLWTAIEPHTQTTMPMSDSKRGKASVLRLNIIEASMVLGSVNALFVTFVAIQARYLFGGQANITAQGYTYAEYARRGFYELLAVSCMTIALLVVVEHLTYRKREEERLFRGLVTLMVLLTVVILVAAFRRLTLYEDAYGFTRIRVMSSTFIIWLAVVLAALWAAIVRHRPEILLAGGVIAGLGFGLSLNVMNMDAYIARHNIERYDNTGKLDVDYLLTLSDDAIPTIVPLLDREELGSEQYGLLYGLASRLAVLDYSRAQRGPFGYHVGEERAWQALDAYRARLEPYMGRNASDGYGWSGS
jgi:hypothetical protein